MLQILVSSDALQLVLDNLLDILLYPIVVVLNVLLHAVVAIGILEVVDDRDWLIMAFLSLHLVGIHDNLGMEDLLLYALGEIVGNGRRFTRFCRELAKRLDIADGFRTLWIEFDREKMKGTIGKNKIENLTFDRIHIKGKHVLLVDDVITTGTSLVQIGKKLSPNWKETIRTWSVICQRCLYGKNSSRNRNVFIMIFV